MPELPANITQARERAQSLAAGAGELGAQQYTVGDVLKQKAMEAYKANQDIIQPLDVATSKYIQAPSEARAKYVDPSSENYVFNPFQAENLVSQYTSQQALPMLSLSSILGQRFGRIEDTIGAGTRGFQAQVAAEQARAQQAQQLYQDLLNEYSMMQPSTQVVEANGRKLLINSATGEIISDLGYADTGGGGGATGLEELLKKLIPNSDLTSRYQLSPGEEGFRFGPGESMEAKLYDPTTGNVYLYDGMNDPEYMADMLKGFIEVQ